MSKVTKVELVERALELLEDDPDTTIGLCSECGESKEGVEPDAEHYECPACKENSVFGAAEVLLRWA